MKTKRRHERFIKRLEVEFSANDQTHRGISSNFSLGGLFIRTNRAFAPGTVVDLIIHFPDGTSSKAKGVVKMAMKTPVVSLKNGMGLEIIEKDQNYTKFVGALLSETGKGAQEDEGAAPPERPEPEQIRPPDFLIVQCAQCGVKNRVSRGAAGRVKCGKCGSELKMD